MDHGRAISAMHDPAASLLSMKAAWLGVPALGKGVPGTCRKVTQRRKEEMRGRKCLSAHGCFLQGAAHEALVGCTRGAAHRPRNIINAYPGQLLSGFDLRTGGEAVITPASDATARELCCVAGNQ